jgi:uncharacterized membrane protein required for colicin V production
MMSLPNVFWLMVIMFGVIGTFRGWAKEILVSFSLLLAIAIDRLLFTYVREVQVFLAPTAEPNLTQFALRAALVLMLAYFGYQTPHLQAFAGKLAREKLQDLLLGLVLGLLNGYLMVGTLWYYMQIANYPLTPYILPPTTQEIAATTAQYLNYMPPVLLGVPQIYFAIIGAFVFVIIVFI